MNKLLSFIVIGLLSFQLVAQQGEKFFTLENTIKRPIFNAEGVYGLHSMKDGQHYCSLEGSNILLYEYKSGKFTDTLVKGSELTITGTNEIIPLTDYTFSKDERKVLLPSETESIYRWSTKSNYYIWDLDTKMLTPLSANGKQRLAGFSPDGSKAAFVRYNNIFVVDLQNGKEKQITHDGADRMIINGTTDWVYEEEFSFIKGYAWSPDGRKLAYYRFDESNVPEYDMQMWGKLYPEFHRYKYPKAGENNSIVTIHIYDVETGKNIQADLGKETDQYIPRIKWSGRDGYLAVQRLNRLQNHLEILLVDEQSGNSRVIYDESNKYYIDISDHLTFTDADHFLMSSEADGYYHIYYYHVDNGLISQLTKGNWDVTNIYGYDNKRKLVFFEAAMSSPMNREVCSVDLKGNITLLSDREGSNSAEFSSSYDYYINTFSDANTPPLVTLNRFNGKQVRELINNSPLMETLLAYGYSKREFFTIQTEDNVVLNAWRILPPGFNPSKKYPVLMYVYGGPGSQTVLNDWGGGNLWYQLLAQQGIVCISVDNRGTGSRGEAFKKMTYLELGKYETIDQIAAAKNLAAEAWVDDERIGIFGWSYGGYMSTLCMTKGSDVFDLGIAVAPVTNWKYYDNIYTERFMRTPQENPAGYEDNSPINFTDGLRGKFMLVHGTGDDNVHVQNSYDLITALVKSDKEFELMIYPNKNHGIYGDNARYHLFRKMTDFILDSFN